jgi:patatin-like phospholipase/acyl hydrolase
MATNEQNCMPFRVTSLILVDASHIAHAPRILSLDGGGVRGLSSLLILREIMEDIEQRTGATETPRPCEYFDLIGGTSTGGLIAIMLGLLGMVHLPSNHADR